MTDEFEKLLDAVIQSARLGDIEYQGGAIVGVTPTRDAILTLHSSELARMRREALEEAALAAEEFWHEGRDTGMVAQKIRALKDKK